jgi:hypothetical protein
MGWPSFIGNVHGVVSSFTIESPACMSPLLLARVNHRSFNLAHGSSMVYLRIDDYALLVCLGGHFHSFRNLVGVKNTRGNGKCL